jgi:hypothetical protein
VGTGTGISTPARESSLAPPASRTLEEYVMCDAEDRSAVRPPDEESYGSGDRAASSLDVYYSSDDDEMESCSGPPSTKEQSR